jgi:hypothetical protein
MVTGIGEELDNVIAATEFTTEIKANIAIRRRRRKTIVQSKPGDIGAMESSSSTGESSSGKENGRSSVESRAAECR